jgi:hypothetical protein
MLARLDGIGLQHRWEWTLAVLHVAALLIGAHTSLTKVAYVCFYTYTSVFLTLMLQNTQHLKLSIPTHLFEKGHLGVDWRECTYAAIRIASSRSTCISNHGA